MTPAAFPVIYLLMFVTHNGAAELRGAGTTEVFSTESACLEYRSIMPRDAQDNNFCFRYVRPNAAWRPRVSERYTAEQPR